MQINEELAEQAKKAYSFSDYQKGSETANYNGYVCRFSNNIEALITENKESYEKNKEAVEYWIDKYSSKLANAINKHNRIITYCPSIMITGGANFPVYKKEKQNNMESNFWKECGSLFENDNYYYSKIYSILTNKVIYSNDGLALEKLQDKLEELKEKQEEMKQANIHFKKNGTMKNYSELTDEEAERFDNDIKRFNLEQKPYESFTLTNNSAKIKSTKDRIAQIEKLKQNNSVTYEKVDGVEVKENKELMRIQLFFQVRPDAEIITLLKSKGFHWSPKEKAWQRQLTPNGIIATNKILINLKGAL